MKPISVKNEYARINDASRSLNDKPTPEPKPAAA
jgi:hypothetical protein